MTLYRKFAILLGLFGLTVAVSIGVAWSFGRLLNRELVRPFEGSTALLLALNELKRDIGVQTRRLPGPARDEPGLVLDLPTQAVLAPGRVDAATLKADHEAFEEQALRVASDIDALVRSPLFSERVGASTARTIEEKVAKAEADARDWYATGEIARGIEAGTTHFQMHELIERVETKVIVESAAALKFGETMQATHNVVLLSGVAATVLLFWLGVLLVHRWVNRPLALLRQATMRFSAGDLGHRVPVESRDEFGAFSREVNQLAERIVVMQREAVERERLAATGEMLKRLAHNIRNPLAGIRGMAELTIKRLGDSQAASADQRQIIQTVDRFNDWLKELLGVTSPVEIAPVEAPVGPWLEQIVQSHMPLASMRGVELLGHFEAGPKTARFDSSHLRHVFAALISNAIQASTAGGRVEVISTLSENQSEWRVQVKDQGHGIEKHLLEKIFRPYFTTKRDGNGIGLAVAQQVVARHQGTIEVETSCEPQNHGTSFFVRIPIGNADRSSAAFDQDSGRSDG